MPTEQQDDSKLNLKFDPFMASKKDKAKADKGPGGPDGAARRGDVNVGEDIFMTNKLQPNRWKRNPRDVDLAADPLMTKKLQPDKWRPAAQEAHKHLVVTISKAEGLPRQDNAFGSQRPDPRKVPVVMCEVYDKPRSRLQSEPASNRNKTDPVWGHAPDYFKQLMPTWAMGDTLHFMVKDSAAPGANVLGTATLPYDQYKAGFEKWLPLKVEGQPFSNAAIYVKLYVAQDINLQADPFMQNLGEVEKPNHCWCCPCCPALCAPCALACMSCNLALKHCCMNCQRTIMNCCSACCQCIMHWLRMCFCGCWICLEECKVGCGMCWRWCMGDGSLRDMRRICAKRCKLPLDDDDEDTNDVACCCMPLRTAVFLISLWCIVNAAIAIFFPTALSYNVAKFTGGYSVQSRVIVGLTQASGLLFGPLGAFGALDLNCSLLSMYNYYQFTRLAGMCIALYLDAPLIMNCDQWKTDIKGAIKEYGWNPTMYNVAMGNGCVEAQVDFVIFSILNLLTYCYLISLTRRLIWDTEKTPKYLLAMPSDVPSGAFVNFSRTQGKSRMPYGAMSGEATAKGVIGKHSLEEQAQLFGLVGPAVMTEPAVQGAMSRMPGAMPPGTMPPAQMGQQPGFQY